MTDKAFTAVFLNPTTQEAHEIGSHPKWSAGSWSHALNDRDEYKRMFEDAVRSLAAIDEALGIDPDEAGGAAPILEAIAKLKIAASAPNPSGKQEAVIDCGECACLPGFCDKSAEQDMIDAERFPYQQTFDAIAFATKIEGGGIAISVEKFRKAFGTLAKGANK